MSGLKTSWATGDVVTAEKLNAMQYAVADVVSDEATETVYLDIKAGELFDLLNAGVFVLIKGTHEGVVLHGMVGGGQQVSGAYTFSAVIFAEGNVTFGCGSADDYPVQGYTPNQNS